MDAYEGPRKLEEGFEDVQWLSENVMDLQLLRLQLKIAYLLILLICGI